MVFHMEVRAKKALGQHFLTDQKIARSIVDALTVPGDVLEIGPGMGVLTQYLLERSEIALKLVEIDGESVDYLRSHFPDMQGRLMQEDFLKMNLQKVFPGRFGIIGNFPYNISSQIFFKILDHKDCVPEVVCMIQKEVAERIAEKPGTKTYGILSVLLQAWYDIEYLFSVGSGCFAPPPKVESAVIRLTRNGRTDLGCDESLFRRLRPAPEDDAEPAQTPYRRQGRPQGMDRRGKGGLHRQPGVRTPAGNLIRGRLHRPDQPVDLVLSLI